MKKDTCLIQTLKNIFQDESEHIPDGFTVTVYIAGGIAVHYWTQANTTKDIDCEFAARFFPEPKQYPYQDEEGNERILYFDRSYSPTLAVMHEDYQDDAILAWQVGNFDIKVLKPIDIAISKLSRWHENDVRDVLSLAKAGLLDADELQRRTEQALSGAIGGLRPFPRKVHSASRLNNNLYEIVCFEALTYL